MPAEYNYAQDSFQNPSSRVCPQVFALSSPSSRGRYSGNFPRLFRKTNECFSQSFIDTSAWNRSAKSLQSTRERALKHFGDTFLHFCFKCHDHSFLLCVVWYEILNFWPCKAFVPWTVILEDLYCTSLTSFDEKHRSIFLYLEFQIKNKLFECIIVSTETKIIEMTKASILKLFYFKPKSVHSTVFFPSQKRKKKEHAGFARSSDQVFDFLLFSVFNNHKKNIEWP